MRSTACRSWLHSREHDPRRDIRNANKYNLYLQDWLAGCLTTTQNYAVPYYPLRRAFCSLWGIIIWGSIQKFPDWAITKWTTINTRWEATQRVMVAKLVRLTHKIATQLHLVAELCHLQFLAPGGQSGNFWIHPHIQAKRRQRFLSTNNILS